MNSKCTRKSSAEASVKSPIGRLSFRLAIHLWGILIILTLVASGAGMVRALHAVARSLPTQAGPFDFGNQTITLDHESLHFTNGFARSPDGQHMAHLTNRSVNQSATRAAAIIIDSVSGSGIFFYVIGAARVDGAERYSTPVFLGDRIKIEAVSVGETTVTINYLDHPANVPLAAPPTQPVAVTYIIQGNGNLQAATL